MPLLTLSVSLTIKIFIALPNTAETLRSRLKHNLQEHENHYITS